MKYLRILGVFILASISILQAVALPNFSQNSIMHEQTRSYIWDSDVNVHMNAPGEAELLSTDLLKVSVGPLICTSAVDPVLLVTKLLPLILALLE